jgi:nickel-dependent lactate racemase
MIQTSGVSDTAAALIGGPGTVLSPEEITGFVRERLRDADLDGRSVCVLVPDGTRSCPLPLLLEAVHEAVHRRASRLTVLVALGTHVPMSEANLARHLGYPIGGIEERFPKMKVMNHAWWDPDTFVSLGRIPAARIEELSGGLLSESVDVRLNRAVVDHDVTLVVGPVFPHEVVGFSGGNKYLFPGIGGEEVIDVSHWLGALITSAEIIGTRGITPVRALIDEAASMVPSELLALCVVVRSGSHDLHAVAFGDTRSAWRAAADVSAETHVRYLDAPVRRVLSVIPSRYEDIWTAAKGFYKVEPVVADGGEVVLYAPHVTEISPTHREIEEVGYHCRDFFAKQWDRYKYVPWGTLAHATHLRGAGTYDPEAGERCRVDVTLATGVSRELTERVNLGYLDPAEVDPAAWAADPGTLVVPDAGEILFRLRGR